MVTELVTELFTYVTPLVFWVMVTAPLILLARQLVAPTFTGPVLEVMDRRPVTETPHNVIAAAPVEVRLPIIVPPGIHRAPPAVIVTGPETVPFVAMQ
jgi:hypothetical protein